MSPIHDSSLTFAAMLKIAGALVLGLFILLYALFQARNLLLGPAIALHGELALIQTDRTVTLQGTTKNIVALHLNGREIHTDDTGTFSEQLVLENGYTIMTLSAKDRYGRRTTLSREFVYQPKTGTGDSVE